MGLEFDHVFAGIAVRGGEVQGEAVVNGFTIGIQKMGVTGVAGAQLRAAELRGDGGCVGTGQAQDADATLAGWGGGGNDGVGIVEHGDHDRRGQVNPVRSSIWRHNCWMSEFEALPVPGPGPIRCAWCAYQHGESTVALALPWLAQALGQPPETLGIGRDSRGRPHLVGSVHDADVNWSHSGRALLVALGRGVRVGVDIEFQRSRPAALALAERFFAPAETMQLRALPETVRETAFTRLWCAKEALLKAHGHGISYGLNRPVFALDGDDWRLIHCDGELGQAEDWTVHPFTPRPGYLAALAWRRVIA